MADKANYDAGTKYSFYLSFQVKEKDGTIKTYTNQTMLSYYKKKNKSQNYSINFASEEDCRAAIAQYEKDVLGKGDKLVENSEYIFITMQPQVAMTIMDQSTGEVQAIVGGRGNKAGNRTWNRATKTCRQPGSTFKIIACYAPALDAGEKRWHPCRMMHHLQSEIKHIIITHIHSEVLQASGKQLQNPSIL